jgi:hypothetical protein
MRVALGTRRAAVEQEAAATPEPAEVAAARRAHGTQASGERSDETETIEALEMTAAHGTQAAG